MHLLLSFHYFSLLIWLQKGEGRGLLWLIKIERCKRTIKCLLGLIERESAHRILLRRLNWWLLRSGEKIEQVAASGCWRLGRSRHEIKARYSCRWCCRFTLLTIKIQKVNLLSRCLFSSTSLLFLFLGLRFTTR